jgi:hypothetical protein
VDITTWRVGDETSRTVWEDRWFAMRCHLPVVDWNNFRRDERLMVGLQDAESDFDLHVSLCFAKNVPIKFCEDSFVGNPKGRYIEEHFVTATSLRHGLCMHSIDKHWKEPRKAAHVVEIGGGFGGFARTFTENFPVASYTLIDSEPCLEVQERYLRKASKFPFTYCVPTLRSKLTFDFVIAINSLGEMDRMSIIDYFHFIQTGIATGGMFYFINMEGKYRYPFDSQWEFLADEYWTPHVRECIVKRL